MRGSLTPQAVSLERRIVNDQLVYRLMQDGLFLTVNEADARSLASEILADETRDREPKD